jgi:hypothetical protein
MTFLSTYPTLRIVLLIGMLGVPALPSTVFSDITGSCGGCGQAGSAIFAQQFTPSATYQLTDVGAEMYNVSSQATINFSIYSDASGLPSVQLTTLTGSIPDGGAVHFEGLVSSGSPSAALTLVGGTMYWLAINLPTSNVAWETSGSSSQPWAKFSAGNWSLNSPAAFQFQIDGTASTIPEPGTLALAGTGIALAVLVRRRRLI